jgi:hypothetical protein
MIQTLGSEKMSPPSSSMKLEEGQESKTVEDEYAVRQCRQSIQGHANVAAFDQLAPDLTLNRMRPAVSQKNTNNTFSKNMARWT